MIGVARPSFSYPRLHAAGRRVTVNAALSGALRRLHRRVPERARRRLHPLLVRGGLVPPPIPDDEHPERRAVLAHVGAGPVLEVGCGPRKTRADFVGVDLVPGGRLGSVGNAAGRASQADVAAHGARLPFSDGTFAALVARHNLEHYVDLVAVLREWQRVLRAGGWAVVVVPDEGAYPGRTLDLDPTHYHAFNPAFVRSLLEVLGWRVVAVEACVPRWSLLVVAEAPDGSETA
jgi:SAM-dependent methyltransferase